MARHTDESGGELHEYVKEDIEKNGIVTPSWVQAKTHVIMDGHMRYQIALVNENRKRQSQERASIRIARQIALLKDAKVLPNGYHSQNSENDDGRDSERAWTESQAVVQVFAA